MENATVEVSPISLDEIPSMPAASVRFVGLCDDPDVEIGQLAQAVLMDPALSAKILRLANSAAFSRGREATSVERSMMLMGLKVAKLTALGFVVSSALSDADGPSPETMSNVWRECLVEAVACRDLSDLANLRSSPEAFLSGMFDGMRKLLGVLMRPDTYGALIDATPWPTPYAEKMCLGMTSNELALGALSSWGIPDLYLRVAEESNKPSGPFDQSEVGRMAAVVVLARQATRLLSGHPGADPRAETARLALGLDSSAVDTIAETIGRHVADLAGAMDINLKGSTDFPALLEKARSRMLETSMDIAQESMLQSNHISALEVERESLHHEATTDRLTGLPNRASFDDRLARLVDDRVARRTVSGSLGLAMIDIDHFKKFNDTYGHRAGDDVLAAVGEALRQTTRDNEVIARYGGEEFVMLMPIVDNLEGLSAAAERVRAVIESLQIDIDGLVLSVTISLGAVAASNFSSIDGGGTLTEAADRLLYQAKHAGRNCCRVEFLTV